MVAFGEKGKLTEVSVREFWGGGTWDFIKLSLYFGAHFKF